MLTFALVFTVFSAFAQDGFDARLRAQERVRAQQAAANAPRCNPLATNQPPPGGWTGWEEGDINISNFTCGMGGADYCVLGDNAGRGDAMLDRLEAECPTTRHPTPLRDLGPFMVGPYADTTFFQELANRTVRATTCQIQILDPAQRQPLLQSGWQMFEELQPLLQVLVQQRTILQREHDSLNLGAADRAGGDFRARQRALREQIANINTGIDGLFAQLPFGQQESVKSALRNFAGRTISSGQFAAAYGSALDQVKTDFEAASCTYQSIRNPRSGVFRLDLSQKIELYNAPGAQDLVRRIDPDGRGLSCQLRRCYETGPRNTQYAAIAALIGVTILSAGTASPFVGAVATVGALGFSAAQIENACGRDTVTATAQSMNECTSSAMAQMTVSKVSFAGCAAEVALGSLDLLPFAAAARSAYRARIAARARNVAVDSGAAASRLDDVIARRIPIGRQADEVPEQAIVVTGQRPPDPNARIERAETRLRDGQDASASFEGFGYSRVLDSPSGVQVFRSASGDQIVLRQGQRLTRAQADQVGDILRRGRGSFTAPGAVADSRSARTLASELGGSAERARIISAVRVDQTASLDRAIEEIFQLTARAEPPVAFDALNPAQRARALTELETGLRVRDPALLNSPEFIAYKRRLEEQLQIYAARVSGDTEDIALRLQGESVGTPPAALSPEDVRLVASGRADEVIARTQGITVDQANRLRQLEGAVADARRAIDEIPGARVPDSIRVSDPAPVPGRAVSGADETSDARGAELEASRERIFREYAGGDPSFRDQEIILDILSGGPRRATYMVERNGHISEDFWRRYLEIENRITASPNRARNMEEFRELTALRIRNGNRAADEEIDLIRRTERNTEIEDIDCRAMASVYPGSFPETGGTCKRVKFTEGSQGNFCSCGARSSRSVNWLIRCPTTPQQFRSLTRYVDELALPHASAPDMCARVEIPRGRECYVGPTSATFAGFGGTAQMLCFNGRSGRAPAVAARERYALDMPAEAAAHVRAIRWSPFATQPEYAEFIGRLAVQCPERCDDIASVRREFEQITRTLETRLTNPADIARFRQEKDLFEVYLRDLQYGRNPLPSTAP